MVLPLWSYRNLDGAKFNPAAPEAMTIYKTKGLAL
jgi:hypothetical protein